MLHTPKTGVRRAMSLYLLSWLEDLDSLASENSSASSTGYIDNRICAEQLWSTSVGAVNPVSDATMTIYLPCHR